MRTYMTLLPHAFSISATTGAALVLTLISIDAQAQNGGDNYPTKPITWVVGWPAGGSADAATRLVAQRLEQALGQPVVVDNKPGASGTIALSYVSRTEPDGYTLITVPGPVISARPVPQFGQELTGIAMMGKLPLALVGTRAKPMPEHLPQLLEEAKANPQRFDFASSGIGTSQHLVGELLNQSAGITLHHVPYKGGSQAAADIIGGQVSLGMLGITNVLPHIQSGRMQAYAVSGANRSQALPDTPTIAETIPGFEGTSWFAVGAPAGLNEERLRKLHGALSTIFTDPAIIASFAKFGIEPEALSPEATTRYVVEDQQRWMELVRKAGIQLD